MGWTADELPDLTGRTAVVTGANSGIGFHAADQLARHGAHVVLTGRDEARLTAAAGRIDGDVDIALLDLADMSSVQDFAKAFEEPLHLLVNNAGVMAPPKRVVTVDGFELQFGTNHLGHFVLTGLLLPALRAADGARVVSVSSVAHHGGGEDVLEANAGPGYHAHHAYQNSKLANLLFARQLHQELADRAVPVTSTAAHPGVAATGLFHNRRGMGANPVVRVAAPVVLPLVGQSAAAGARSVLFAASVAEPGSYTGPQRLGETRGAIGPARLSRHAADDGLARRMWHVSEELTGFRYPW